MRWIQSLFALLPNPDASRLRPAAITQGTGLAILLLAALAPAATAVRFMPTGDSITHGVRSTDDRGFRPLLHQYLNAVGTYDFVGPSGTDPYRGFFNGGSRIENFLSGGTYDLGPVIAGHTPEVIAIHLGTNDLNSTPGPYAPWSTNHSTPTTTASGDLGALIEYALSEGVGRVVVSRVIPLGGRAEDTQTFNREVVRMVLDYRNGAATGTPERVTLADHYQHFLTNPDLFSGGPNDWMYDNLHPNDRGYSEMADVYLTAVREAVNDATPPDAVDDLAVGTVSGDRVLLIWTNTGDDGLSGNPAYADARYATGSISAANFRAQNQGGDYERIGPGLALTGTRLSGLAPSTSYNFALKLMDDAGNLSAMSNVASGSTIVDPNSYADSFSRNMPAPGPDWRGPDFVVNGAELENTAAGFATAIFTYQQDVASVEITWGDGADATGIDQAGIACRMEGTDPATADGYIVYRNTEPTDQTVVLREVVNGQPGALIATSPGAAAGPQAGDRFKVVLTTDATGHHFSAFINGQPDAVVTDPQKRRGNGTYWCGVIGDGQLNNNVANWQVETNPVNLPPSPFDLLAPANGITLANLNPYFDWQNSLDPNGDPITYTLYYSTDPGFSPSTTTTVADLTESFFAQGEPILPNRTFYWKVRAEDPQGAFTYSTTTRSFSTGNIQQLGDDFERTAIGPNWTVTPGAYALSNGELDGLEPGYSNIATYRLAENPVSIEWQWSETADPVALGQAGGLIGLDANTATANGYFVFRNSIGAQRWGVFAVVNGVLSGSLGIDQPGRGPLPGPGDVIRVVFTKTASAHIFDCYVNGVFDARMTDSQRRYGLAPATYSGLLLGENAANNVESFAAMGANLNLPPEPFALLEPADGSLIYSLSPLLRWEAANDPNPGDQLSYTVIYDTDPGFASPDSLPPTTSTETTYSGNLVSGEPIYWRVVVTDGAGATAPSIQTWSFQFAPILTFIDDFNRAELGPNWSGDTNVIKIVSNELKNTANGSTFDIAVYAARSNPDAVEFTWSPSANLDGIRRGGLALRLNNTTGNPSGYFVYIDPVTNRSQLAQINNGNATSPLADAAGQTDPPGPGKRFKVALSSDAAGHHFDISVDGVFHSRLSDPNRRQGNGTVLYAGVALRGGYANSLDDFTMTAFNFGPPPTSFALLVPAHQDTGVAVAPTFRWRAAGEPGLRYTVYVGTDSSFATADSVAALTDTTAAWPTPLALATDYVWRVRATDGPNSSFNENGWHRFRTTTFSPVELSSLSARTEPGAIVIEWATSYERDHLGFHVWRAEDAAGSLVRLTAADALVTGRSPYTFTDRAVTPSQSYRYWIEAVGLDGSSERYGPVMASAPGLVLALHPVAPNPATPPASIRFDLPAPATVELLIFDASGRRVSEVLRGPLAAGSHIATWDGRTAGGERASSGVYFARLVVGDFQTSRKLLLLR